MDVGQLISNGGITSQLSLTGASAYFKKSDGWGTSSAPAVRNRIIMRSYRGDGFDDGNGELG